MSCPDNIDILPNSRYLFMLDKFPQVSYMGTAIAIPNVNMMTLEAYPHEANYMLPGDRITYEILNMTFMVDSKLDNYVELFRWMKRMTKIDNTHITEVSTASLFILDSDYQPIRELVFQDVYPVNLTDINFSTQQSETKTECVATFQYSTFDFA